MRYKCRYLSSVDLDGSHTPAMRGGQEVEYQKRKRRKTTNALYLSDRQGLPLSMGNPVAGNHSDLYKIEAQFEGGTVSSVQANIAVDGLFLNADVGVDSKVFREVCHSKGIVPNICLNKRNGKSQDRDEYFDRVLYNQKYSVERTNARMDSFRSSLNRFDTTVESWKGLNDSAFIVIAIKKFNKKKFK